MADAKPVAIRVSRPHGTEDELLEHEAETISKSGIVLLGVKKHPEGAVLRFEVTLSDGKAVMRGEGRVTGMKTVAGQTGLALRFTRLDSKSKALIDRAGALREARAGRKSAPPPEPSEPAKDIPEPLPSEPKAEAPPKDLPEPLPSEPKAEPPPTEPKAEEPKAGPEPPAVAPGVAKAVAPPGDKDTVLARLRERSRQLSAEQVAKILASAPR